MLRLSTIDILYFDACPTWERAVRDVHRILSEAHLESAVAVRLVPVTTDEQAQRLRFLGSPTVRVDGVDVDPSAAAATTFGLQCRLYGAAGGAMRTPPSKLIRAALGLDAGVPCP